MRAIETMATVTEDGTLTVLVPPDIAPGVHRVVVVVDETVITPKPYKPLKLHTWKWLGYPPDFRFRREDLYGDDGR